MKTLMTLDEYQEYLQDYGYTSKSIEKSIEQYYMDKEDSRVYSGKRKLTRIFSIVDLHDYDGDPVGYAYVYKSKGGRMIIRYKRSLG